MLAAGWRICFHDLRNGIGKKASPHYFLIGAQVIHVEGM